jgi:seryl-tRNA synthetase
MLDLRRLREDAPGVRAALARRGDPALDAELERVLRLDAERRELIRRVEALKARRNEVSKRIGALKRAGRDAEAAPLLEEMREVAASIDADDARLEAVEAEIEEALLRIPNTPWDDVPAGGPEANRVVRTWGEPVSPAPWRRPHWEVGARLGILDLERGAKLAGSGFPLFRGAGARLQRALIDFMIDLHVREHGYEELYPPFLARTPILVGTGQLPKFADDLYHVPSDDLWLIPTAEVPVTNVHAGEILEPEEMPRRYVAYTPCFRREAGAAGRETRGLIRVHQFDKVELVRLERPEDAAAALEELTAHAEAVLRALGLAYRVVLLAAGDLGFANAKTYDLEVWAPGVERWLEVSSCSLYTDYQARRANLRYRPAPGAKPEYVHTLNGSGLALPRTVIALLECYQTEDGAVEVPAALRPYLGMDRIERA